MESTSGLDMHTILFAKGGNCTRDAQRQALGLPVLCLPPSMIHNLTFSDIFHWVRR